MIRNMDPRNTLHDDQAVQTITRLTAFTSIVACSIVARQCVRLKQRKQLTHMDKLVLVLCLIDLGLAIAWFVGNWSRHNSFACPFQTLGVMDIFWTAVIAFHIYSLIVLNFTFRRAEKMFKYALVVVASVSSFIGTCLWVNSAYAYTSLWCSIQNYQTQFCVFYSFVMITAVAIGYIHFRVSRIISRHFKSLQNKGYKRDLVHINNKVTQVLIIFLITHFFGLLNRSIEGGTGHAVRATGVLHALLMPLRGFLNSLVFGLRGRKPPLLCLLLARRFPIVGKIFFFEEDLEDDMDGLNIDLTRVAPNYRETAIFTTTFNLGECDLESIGNLAYWIPHGYDLYVVGLQECLCMEELQAAIHKHLGGNKHYIMFKQAIGSKQTKLGFHGMISLTVFARTDEVRNGAFVPYAGANAQVKQGVNLGVVKAANKGAVGLGFRYYDASIGFLTCHFASDSKGKTKLAKRNSDAFNTLREAVLVSDNAGFDAHLQHHHTIILGDMNYRISQPPRLIIEMVAWAAIQERDRSGPHWRTARYKEFYPDEKGELPIYIPDPPQAKSGWNTLISFDELSQMLANNVVLTGFEESRIRWPPSYRRKRGLEGECGDYTDTAMVGNAFTTQLAGEHEMDTTGLRPPSYTDRIVYHSLDDKREFLRKGMYELCDAVKGSDHRPVAQAFFLKVNGAIAGPSGIGDLIPMKLTVSDLNVDFATAPKASLFDHGSGFGEEGDEHEGREDEQAQRQRNVKKPKTDAGPALPRSMQIDSVTVMFPLPAEDPLVHQRKAAELARALGNDQTEMLSNIESRQFDHAQRTGGLEIIGKTRPELGLHALIKFCNVNGEELGQGVICLPDPGSKIMQLVPTIRLSLGGTLRGRVTAKVRIEQMDLVSAALIGESHGKLGTPGGPLRSPTLGAASFV